MDNKRFNLASHWAELGESFQKICLKEIDFKDPMIITKGWNPTRQFRLLEVRENIIRENKATIQAIEGQLTQTGHIQIPSGSQGAGQISSPVASHHSETNRSTQEPEVVVNNSRINSPLNINITPTQIEHNAVSPESNLKSDALLLQMSQYSEQTQKQFAELEASHERMKKLTASMDKILKPLQEGHAKLRKASEETNRRLNIVLEEQNHSRRDRDCLDQDINKLFNVYHNMKPQPQGHVMYNPYYQDDIKPDAMLVNKARSPSQYQDRDNMSYFEKEALKQLPEASRWPKFSGTGEYDHIELIDYIYGLFFDVPSIPDYCITARLNTAFKGHANDIANTLQDVRKRTNIGRFTPYRSSSFKEKQPFRVEFKDKPKEIVAEVTKKKNSCHNCGSTDHYANNYPKTKKKVYAIEKVPEDSYSDSMGDAIREQSD
ncbi:hypothetical protein O181_013518 [Austropuccinia psidii MF-1]|uniref:Uncharacterized protein n=1 Tax=Austropuccinia psidii MF-1 TaxID=1389203 RepID=A0A9Q3BZD7_9BASI|nr:hypothetical protein [Austropuccinia psidii MF-1]